MEYNKPVKSILRVLLCSLTLTLLNRLFFYLKMQFPRYFPFKKESACWLQILDEDILLKNWFTVLYVFGTLAIFFNYRGQFRLLSVF